MQESAGTTGLVRPAHLIITRPEPEASLWAGALVAGGWPARALPLIEIAEPQEPAVREALNHWRRLWPSVDAVMFVSGAAVSHFFRTPASAALAGSATRFWAPGPATAAALRAVGIPGDRIDAPAEDAAQFDSENLWPQVAQQARPGVQVLIVRGASDGAPAQALVGSGRDWLIGQCEAAGARVQACVAYERRAPAWSAAQLALADAARGPRAVWLFSSSEALVHLHTLLPGAPWQGTAAVTTHPRIAEAARQAGFGPVITTRPGLPDVMRTLESLWSPA